MDHRSDADAKTAFLTILELRGYSARITKRPADITARRGELTYYFEIKSTSQTDTYFGAATLTEWEAALEHEGRFWFVVAIRVEDRWEFKEYTPADFMAFSYIPPFKIFFNVPLRAESSAKRRVKQPRLQLTRDAIELMVKFYKELRPRM